jgi:hypothetical protein
MVVRSRGLGVVIVISLWVLGCGRAPDASAGAKAAAPPLPAPALTAAGSAAQAPSTELRRIVKKASLELTVARPADTAATAARIAEREKGFVASTEREQTSDDGHRDSVRTTLTLRIPAERFSAVLDELRRLGTGDGSESITTDDVSEEFIDLDARLKNQRELEAQFLEILKRATKVEEALGVERELATVRTEIDRMQGRRRFLERETALSTITLSLLPERPLVHATLDDFTSAVARAGSDTVNLSADIVAGSIRVLGVLVPLAAFFGLPLVFVLRARRRRSARLSSAS